VSHAHDDALAHVREHNPHVGQGSVLLDIGGSVGALMVTCPDSWAGEEVDIEGDHPVDHLRHEHHHGDHDHGHGHGHDPGARAHVAVVPRPVPGGEVVASLVFPGLEAGRYRLYRKGGDTVLDEVEVAGGQVTVLDWSDDVATMA